MREGYYENKLTYPGHPTYKPGEDEELQNFVGTYKELKEFEKSQSEKFNENLKKLQIEYGNENARLGDEFIKDLEEEFGVTGHPKAGKLYSIAYSHGHSSGYSEVYNYYSEFVELIID